MNFVYINIRITIYRRTKYILDRTVDYFLLQLPITKVATTKFVYSKFNHKLYSIFNQKLETTSIVSHTSRIKNKTLL